MQDPAELALFAGGHATVGMNDKLPGVVCDALILQKLFFIPLGDADATLAYFQHYFLGEN